MLRSAQPSQFSTYPSQYIDTPVLAVLNKVAAKNWKTQQLTINWFDWSLVLEEHK